MHRLDHAGSGRLELRLARRDDVDALHELFRIPDVYAYLADGVEPPRAIPARWVDENSPEVVGRGLGTWLLLEAGAPEVLGCVRLEPLEEEGAAELTYVVHPRLWGQGVATRMAWTLIEHARERGVSRVVAGADAPNLASIAVMEKLGMKLLRRVDYPMGEGVEYELTAASDPPAPLPRRIPLRG